MSLCTICQGVCEDRKWENEEVTNFLDHKDPVVMLSTEGCAEIMHDSWQTFLVSLSQDCPICWSMWRIMRSSPLANPKEEDPDNFQTVICSAIYRLEHSYYSVQLGIVEKGDFLSYPCFDIWKTTEDCFLEEEKRNTIQKLHTPATVAQLANKWVVDCVNSHSRCHQRNIPSSTRPTRLLDIGNGGSSQWSIIETEGNIRMCERYVALSHRWAETMPKLLRKGGYRAQSSYEDRELPQHFQDIISICRAMAVRYLWIDSLCIFQDSAEDFQQEASIMADIYQNAFLTLSICWDYSSVSLFRDTSPQTIPRPPPADFLASRVKKFNKFSILPAGHAFVEYTEGFEVDVADSLINGRGWVVQERFLSHRIVYLGNEQVYWECDVHIASEAVPQNLKDFGRRTDLDAGIGHLSWPSVMKAYSKCSLTRQEDKLIAISGLARSIAKRSGHSYFSGIWIEYWIQDLMWFPNTMTIRTADAIPENEMIDLTDTLEAPSWLWLGCSKQILLGSIPRDPEFTSSNLCSFKGQNGFAMALLVDSKLKLPATSEEAFVSFAGASLDIICLPLLIDFNEKEMIERISHLKLGASHFWQKDVKGEGAQISCLPLQFPNSAAQEKEISTEADKINFEFSQRYEPSVPCFLIPLYARAGNRGEGPGRFQEPIMQGLVVQQTSNGQFKRIACFDQGRHHNYGISSVVLNTISKQKLGAHGTSEMDREEAYKAAFLQYATTQTSLPMFADSTDDAKLSWSQVPQIKDLSWTKIELI